MTPLLLPSLLQISLEMVDYKGNVVTANSTHNSDLLWASCGGGGGLGVVTRWTVKAHDLGTEPFSRIIVSGLALAASRQAQHRAPLPRRVCMFARPHAVWQSAVCSSGAGRLDR